MKTGKSGEEDLEEIGEGGSGNYDEYFLKVSFGATAKCLHSGRTNPHRLGENASRLLVSLWRLYIFSWPDYWLLAELFFGRIIVVPGFFFFFFFIYYSYVSNSRA